MENHGGITASEGRMMSKVSDSPISETMERKIRKSRKPRKHPLMALGNRRVGTDMSDTSTSKMLLEASSLPKKTQIELYAKMLQSLGSFIAHVNENWQPDEECRRFDVFRESITCALWNGEGVVSGVDVCKIIMAIYRLNHMGEYPRDRRKFEEGIVSDLRNLRVNEEAFLEDAGSPLLRFLFLINSVRTHKRQKVFKWNAVPFQRLYGDALDRERRAATSNSLIERLKRTKLYHDYQAISKLQLNRPRRSSITSTSSMDSNGFEAYDGSPHSWGSPETASPQNCTTILLPSPIKDDPGIIEMLKLAIVADAALTESEAEERPALPPIRELSSFNCRGPRF